MSNTHYYPGDLLIRSHPPIPSVLTSEFVLIISASFHITTDGAYYKCKLFCMKTSKFIIRNLPLDNYRKV